jgi:serine/threonine protein kinase
MPCVTYIAKKYVIEVVYLFQFCIHTCTFVPYISLFPSQKYVSLLPCDIFSMFTTSSSSPSTFTTLLVLIDLKPENLLLLSKHTDSDIKIADFGFAAEVTSDNCLTDMCGTPNYVAPEVIKMGSNSERGKGYGLACDMWSVGVIIFVLLGGYPPFEDDDQKVWRVC